MIQQLKEYAEAVFLITMIINYPGMWFMAKVVPFIVPLIINLVYFRIFIKTDRQEE